MILILDNHDSFVYTLARYIGLCGFERQVVRSDAMTVSEVLALAPAAIILSPGPGEPHQAGICLSLVKALQGRIPILGVCLGHQAIVAAYGGRVGRAVLPLHGVATNIYHHGQGMFAHLPNPMLAGRYHSLAACQLPSCLEKIAESAEVEVMAVQHVAHPVWGVQFHPESILTPQGMRLMKNFMEQIVVPRSITGTLYETFG